jgi:putative SOS response-associated peptidase YedK
MCGRFAQKMTIEQLIKRYGFDIPVPMELRPRYNVAPTQPAAVITQNENGKNRLEFMDFGFIIPWSKSNDVHSYFNLQSETLLSRDKMKQVLEKYRCIIPASAFVEPRKVEKKVGKKEPNTPFGFFPADDDWFSLGGVYSVMEMPNGKEVRTFAIITTEADDLIEKINHPRMPVIIPKTHESTWLNHKSKLSDYVIDMAPYPSKELRGFQLQPAINSWKNDSPTVLEPVAALI